MTDPDTARNDCPDLSLIMPCYNEEAAIEHTIPQLLAAFEQAGHVLQLVAVDNGSSDRTGDIIHGFAAMNPGVVHRRVDRNEGYGNGVLSGLPACTARHVGIIAADGQVDPADVVRLYETLTMAGEPVVAKVRRRFRADGLRRKVISVAYNILVRVLWPRLGSIDVNGTPKILPRDITLAIRLKSKDWFLDPEILIKAHYVGLPIVELNVLAHPRSGGLSHVRMTTCWEFLRNLLVFRFSGELRRWRKQLSDKQPRAKISVTPR